MSFARRRDTGAAPLKRRFVLLFAGICGAAFFLYAALIYRTVFGRHEEVFDAMLFNLGVDVGAEIETSRSVSADLTYRLLKQEDKKLPFSLYRTLVRIVSANGVDRFRSATLDGHALPSPLAELPKLRASHQTFRDVIIADKSYRLMNFLVSAPPHEEVILQIAAPLTVLDREKRSFQIFILLSVPAIFFLSGSLGWFLLGGLFDKLQHSLDREEALIANVAHQLKTPLAVLRGELDLLSAKPALHDDVRKFIQSASGEARSLSRLVEDLLTAARLDSEMSHLPKESVRVDEALFEALAPLEKLARRDQKKLRVNLAGDAFAVKGESGLLRILQENLIENALKFSPTGETVSIDLKSDDKNVVLTVRDNGEGIAPGDRERIFERFYRSVHARAFPGSGLGLSVAKQIATLHRGEISVESELGHGACFKVRLPRVIDLE